MTFGILFLVGVVVIWLGFCALATWYESKTQNIRWSDRPKKTVWRKSVKRP